MKFKWQNWLEDTIQTNKIYRRFMPGWPEVEFTAFFIVDIVDKLCLFWSQSILCSDLNMLVIRQWKSDFVSDPQLHYV